jgi:class 3 adenylate cyclase
MAAINLEHLIAKKKVTTALQEMIAVSHTPIRIQNSAGHLLFGTENCDDQSQSYAIEVAGEILGWVIGKESAFLLANFLSYLAAAEAKHQALAAKIAAQRRELNLLYKISESISACLDPQEIAEMAIEEALRIIKGNSASVMLLRSGTDKMEIVAGCGTAALLKGKPIFDTKTGIAGSIFSSGRGEIINDTSQDSRFVPGENPVSSLICAPLKTKNTTIGVINLSSEQPAHYQTKDLQLLTALAAQVAAAIENAMLHQNKLQQERIKSQLERYVPAQLVHAIIDPQEEVSLAPGRKSIAILFSDIRNFTTTCEELEAETIVSHLNEYFTHMVDVIFSHEGTVDKFVGDMIVALFGAPSQLLSNEEQAIAAAIAMQDRIRQIPIPWIRENFKTGIGITSGRVVVGNIGSPRHMDYTAIGDEVNLASRLQAIAKGGQILTSRSVYDATKHLYTYREFGNLLVKGKRNTVQVFEVLY